MLKLILLLCCVGSLVAVNLERKRLEFTRKDMILKQDARDILNLSDEELVMQKQLLDLLMNIEKPLQDSQLKQLKGDISMDPSNYKGDIDTEMLHVMQLWNSKGMLKKTENYFIVNEDHVRQLVGVYRILVRSVDWDVFLENACAFRDKINSALFANSLILAIRDRPDCRNLIIPGLHDILPYMFFDEYLLNRIQDVDISKLTRKVDTIRPNLMDIIGLSHRQKYLGNQIENRGMMTREQLWMPWQLMHKDLAKKKLEAGKRIDQDKIILPLRDEEQNPGLDMYVVDTGMREMGLSLAMSLQLGSIESVPADKKLLDKIRVQSSKDEDLEADSWKIENLPMSDIESARLLKIGRRRSQYMTPNNKPMLEYFVLNSGNEVSNARLVLDEDDEEDDSDRLLDNLKRRLEGLDYDANTVHLHTTNVGNNRLLRVNRRYQNKVHNIPLYRKGHDIKEGRWTQEESEEEILSDKLASSKEALLELLKRIEDLEYKLEDQKNVDEFFIVDHLRNIQESRVRLEKSLMDLKISTQNVISSSSRIPRSVNSRPITEQTTYASGLLHVLQQYMARLNIERFSLGLPRFSENLLGQPVERMRFFKPQLLRRSLSEAQIKHFNETRVPNLPANLILNTLNELSTMMQKLNGESFENTQQIDEIIGPVMQHKIVDIMQAVTATIHQVRGPKEILPIADLGYFMYDPIPQGTLEAMVKLVAMKRFEVKPYTRQELEMPGVVINSVQTDDLITFVEDVDADMSNLLQLKGDQPKVMIREKRLNHKPFNIHVDISSKISQRAVVRVILVPIYDDTGYDLPVEEAQANSYVLDATMVDLIPGQNLITFNSEDVAWTTRDTTSVRDLYRKVMLALNKQLDASESKVIQHRCSVPQRLMLPRGSDTGFMMQMLVVVSPAPENEVLQRGVSEVLCSFGVSTLNLDNLPLMYPLDRKLESMESLKTIPNIYSHQVLIHHMENNEETSEEI